MSDQVETFRRRNASGHGSAGFSVQICYRDLTQVSYYARMTEFPRVRKQFGIWLALLAMCLIVFAPLISQFSAAERGRTPVAIVCSASGHTPGSQLHDAVDLSACGYCNLLATSAPPPIVMAMTSWLPLLTAVFATPARRVELTGIAYLAGYPRAPPSLP
ncbi:DUF2946 domain-containing protein [Paraburkholderia sp. Ac-20347]|uniref:DUF2946 domain-containing protein n=1 Tax=Paraburkholderia sp. Ac-20347 TaxID=2703892 RepID=UPI001F123021|nr:DUF2946 domain-containing protein [Paraburkholderia sp. Ac-20347]